MSATLVRRAPSRRSHRTGEAGYAMAALLVGLSVMAVLMSVALPVWSTAAKRAREDELVFRGEQYARAIGLYQRKYANALPPSIDVLVNEKFLRKKYLDPVTGGQFQALTGAVATAGRPPGPGGPGAPGGAGRAGAAPGAAAGAGAASGRTGAAGPGAGAAPGFQTGAIAGGAVAGGISGVTSRSKDKSLRLYNGHGIYNEWAFVAVQRTLDAGGGAQGAQTPGAPGRGGRAGAPGAGAGIGRPGGAPGAGSFRPPTGGGRGFRPSPDDDDDDDD